MSIFTQFAQTAPEAITTYEPLITSGSEAAAVAGVMALLGGLVFIAAIFALASYIVSSLCLMQIFKKAGVPAWMAWVPFVNSWKLLEIGGQQGFWAVLAIIPVVNIVSAVMIYIAQYHVGLKLGKSGAFLLWAIFLPIVWLIWLAVDKSTWNEAASPAPSLDPNTPQSPTTATTAQPVTATQPTVVTPAADSATQEQESTQNQQQ